MKSTHAFRIYYEDTDAGGVVYYAGYLRFLERARTEMLREMGLQQNVLLQQNRLAFAVRSLSVEYLKPARLDDWVDVISGVRELGRAQLVFLQRILRGDEVLLEASVRVASIDPVRGKAVPIPKEIHQKFKTLIDTSL